MSEKIREGMKIMKSYTDLCSGVVSYDRIDKINGDRVKLYINGWKSIKDIKRYWNTKDGELIL